ncbi:MAG: carboxypeptidase M32 [Methanoregulaceae archaeon]|nr:carboxypeptidase M32 [Methanoregulaceae archaeon]
MSALNDLKARYADINALSSAIAIMDWDQQTYMPRGAAEARAEHVGALSRIAHELSTDDAFGKLVSQSKNEAQSEDDLAMVRVLQREYDLKTKLPAEFVAEKSRLAAIAHEDWVKARAENNFAGFAPTLERMFEIARQEAEFLGYTDHIYDALLDQYEEGAKAADCVRMFEALKGPNVELVKAIKERGRPIDDSRLHGEWPNPLQSEFTEHIVKAIGFDFERGRQDAAPHPFCTTFSIGDVRLTTRYKPYIGSAIFGSLHEAGHGMYEQGSPMAWDRTPLAGGVSLGIHESQSRTWENIVGRSKAFWQRFLPDLQAKFPTLADISLDDWYRMINKVEPSFIRVEADEVTYNLHVLVRFEIECDVLTGKLAVKDMPEAWNAKYESYLGIRPKSDSEGCLQDVHWSMGAIGYFPTYSMGNLLSYQIWNKLVADLGDVDDMIARGEFAPILGWLQEKVYRQGCKFPPKELVMRVTGKPMGAEDYLAGLGAKYRAIYEL